MLDGCVSGPFCVTILASLEWLKKQTFIISHYLWTRNWPWFTWRTLPVSPWGLGVWTHWVRSQEFLCHGLNAKSQMPLHMATYNIQACSLEWGTRKREGQRERKLQYKWRSGNYTLNFWGLSNGTAATAAKSHQSCLTLCDPIDGSPPGSSVPGNLQARTLGWVAISFSNAWKWKVKVKSLSPVWLSAIPWTAAYQAPPSMGFSRKEYWSGSPVPSLSNGYNHCI